MDELGLALVDESFRRLHAMLLAAREDGRDPKNSIRRSVGVLAGHVRENPAHLRFIARERHGGSSTIRRAVRSEIRLFTSELVTDLARVPALAQWSTEDLNMAAQLMVNTMIAAVAELLECPPGDALAEQEVLLLTEKQLRLIVLGVGQWRGQGAKGTARKGTTRRPARERS